MLDPVGPQRDLDPAEVDRALAVNIGGVVNGTRVFTTLARMFPDRPGVLVNVSSGAATSIYEGWSIYGATKAAVDQFTRITAAERAWAALLRRLARPRRHRDAGEDPGHQQEEVPGGRTGSEQAHDLGAWNSPDWVGDHLLGILAGTLRARSGSCTGCRTSPGAEPWRLSPDRRAASSGSSCLRNTRAALLLVGLADPAGGGAQPVEGAQEARGSPRATSARSRSPASRSARSRSRPRW